MILGGDAKERERDADSLIFELTAAPKAECGLFEAGSILSRSGRAPRFADSDLRDIVHGLKSLRGGARGGHPAGNIVLVRLN